MFSSNSYRSIHSRFEMTDDQIRAMAPSVFAAAPAEGVSNRYTFLPTAQIVSRMRAEGWAPVEAREQHVRSQGRLGYQKHLLRFQWREQVARPGEFAAELCLVNSHDRSSAYQLSAGLWRFVCSNGLMVSDTTIQGVSIRHSGRETDEVIQASFAMFQQIHQLADRVAAFQARHMTDADKSEFARQAIALRWESNAPISPERALLPHRTDDVGHDLWRVYNRVQEALIKGGVKDYGMRRPDGHRYARTRPVTGLDEGIKLNRGLWELAENFSRN